MTGPERRRRRIGRRRALAGLLAMASIQLVAVVLVAPDPAKAVTCAAEQWTGDYFANTTLAGPAADSRCDDDIRFDWGETGPGIGGIGGSGYSARWTRSVRLESGEYSFSATADDGVRIYLDDALVIDEWRDQGPTAFTATRTVVAGTHKVTVEYYQGGGGGLVRAGYSGGGDPGEIPPPPSGGCTGDCQGSWEVLPYQSPVRSVHATVLRTGNVLLVAGSGNNGNAAANNEFVSKVWNPSTGEFADVPTQEDLFCAGHTQLPDGRILLAGGTLEYPTPTTNYKGLAISYLFDPMTNTYTKTNDTPGGGHWYPSLVNLGNGSVFATGGLNENGSGNVAVEMFDAKKNQWKPFNEVPQTYFYWGLYPNMVLMADGRLFYAGTHTFGNALPNTSGSEIYDIATGTITDVPGLRDIDFRDQGATVLLPPAQAQKVADFGGGNTYSDLDPTNHTDIIDLRKEDPQWTSGPDLPAAKMYVSAVILPDGKVFETGGAKHNYAEYAVPEASMYDPVANTFTPVPADPLARMYHSESFLLPDGRVASIGNNPATGEFDLGISVYSPWYMSRQRPTITAAADQFDLGSTQNLTVSGNIGRVTLIRPASVTHQSDPNQRSVDLPITGTGTNISVAVPSNPNIIPAGYYMMFVQDMNGVPSVAKWVHVG
ncbi:galactose oxidase-like domain-containing protein [Protofrankia symbiont of Coriaria ruscifolia]|uniref:galactose oxidase-like domain-containing protein n=1 Tax=Protofrankia symbiont of Coriaria ruscifolia TaxID=1306542 RepID=UPI001F5FB12A|nr:galactose oxidase-like domain-containing protein [Protofrankia symbiont of Coriaria ruscifolia]